MAVRDRRIPAVAAHAPVLTKAGLHELADGLVLDIPGAIERCVEFVVADTRGHWHNRARAMMCRRLKHCALAPEQRERLVAAILARLAAGDFTEQFRDQLRLALHVDRAAALAAARACAASPRAHVARLAAWVLAHAAR